MTPGPKVLDHHICLGNEMSNRAKVVRGLKISRIGTLVAVDSVEERAVTVDL